MAHLPLCHDPQFQDRCAEAYGRLHKLALVADEVGHSKETVRQALIGAGVPRTRHGRRIWDSDADRLEAHYSLIRSLKKEPRCIICGLLLTLPEWGDDWPPINEEQQICGWCDQDIT